ncbi:hypothetical protein J2T56_002041 [Natronobacillus azotifigens]
MYQCPCKLRDPNIDGVSRLNELGHVFCVFDQQDSGNISFGLEKDNKRFFVKYAGAKPRGFYGNQSDAVARLKEAIPVYKKREYQVPKFKSKRHKQSYTTNVVNGNIQLLEGHINHLN